MNYFEFFGIPISFIVEKDELKRLFYENSKKYHPDFFTLESEEKQAEILKLSSYNNEAYEVLKDFDKRLKYILELKGILEEEGKYQLSQTFLMEMMDINEILMEIEFDFDESKYQKVLQNIENQEHTIRENVRPIIENYEDKTTSPEDLSALKDYYLKRSYLLRIRENLNKFAPRN